MARQVRLRVRPGRALIGWNESGSSVQYSAGDEFLVSYEDGAKLLAGKGRRSFEIVEVIEEGFAPDDVPTVVLGGDDQVSN